MRPLLKLAKILKNPLKMVIPAYLCLVSKNMLLGNKKGLYGERPYQATSSSSENSLDPGNRTDQNGDGDGELGRKPNCAKDEPAKEPQNQKDSDDARNGMFLEHRTSILCNRTFF
jgi:hypothetical protein